MSETIIETVVGESESLELHVDLCQRRYLQLLAKFDLVDEQLQQLTAMVTEIKNSVTTITTSALHTYLKWAGFIIITLLGVVIHYATR